MQLDFYILAVTFLLLEVYLAACHFGLVFGIVNITASEFDTEELDSEEDDGEGFDAQFIYDGIDVTESGNSDPLVDASFPVGQVLQFPIEGSVYEVERDLNDPSLLSISVVDKEGNKKVLGTVPSEEVYQMLDEVFETGEAKVMRHFADPRFLTLAFSGQIQPNVEEASDKDNAAESAEENTSIDGNRDVEEESATNIVNSQLPPNSNEAQARGTEDTDNNALGQATSESSTAKTP